MQLIKASLLAGLFLVAISPLTSAALAQTAPAATPGETIELLDPDLTRWEIWMGVPHETVEGLPAGTYQSDNVHKGTPMGLGNDPKQVFTMIEEDGTPVLYVTGEIYGGITTLESFGDYHLSMDFKWGDKKWAPRLNAKRDSGLLYHCYGDHGAFWKTWKACLEFQIQEKDFGDFIGLAGPTALVRGTKEDGKIKKYDPTADTLHRTGGYTQASHEPDKPNGEWNRLDLYVLGDRAVHMVNGEIVMVLIDARDGDGNPLTEGQIQLQSEAAECYYKNIRLTPITAADLPPEVAELIVGIDP
ncbi:MAG: DUF1080 domain-containing protein [Planctomycetota bacterium]